MTLPSETLRDAVTAQLIDIARQQIEEQTPTAVSPLPPGTPILATIKQFDELFNISSTNLQRLSRVPGFPAVRVGGSVRIIVFDALEWFRQYAGTKIDLPN